MQAITTLTSKIDEKSIDSSTQGREKEFDRKCTVTVELCASYLLDHRSGLQCTSH